MERLNRRTDALAWTLSLGRLDSAPGDLGLYLLYEEVAMEREIGHFREAERHLVPVVETGAGDKGIHISASLNVLCASIALSLEEAEQADRCLSRAEDYARRKNDHSLDPYLLHYRGRVLSAGNRFEEAASKLRDSLRLFESGRQTTAAANVMISLAWCYYRLGQMEKALDLYQRALPIAIPEDRHLVLGHIGNIFLEQGDLDKAAANYKEAADEVKGRDPAYYVRWLQNLAQALIELGKWDDAEKYNNEVREIEKKTRVSPQPLTLVNAGRIAASKGNFRAAERDLLDAVAANDVQFALDAYSELGQLYARARRTGKARLQFEAALSLADRTTATLHEDENKLSYLSSLIDVHRKYVDFLMEGGDSKTAFSVAESSRARLLRERLNLPRSRRQGHTIEEFQAAARSSGTTFLAYWLGRKKAYLWAITGARFQSFPLPAEQVIRGLVERHQQAMEKRGTPSAAELEAGYKLYDLLLARNGDVLKPQGKYVIVPDGALYALNFETLPVPGETVRYWIKDATVALAPSLDLLLTRQAESRAARSVLLVGDASEWSPDFPKLLHAHEEMENIRRQLPAVSSKILFGDEATPIAYQHAEPGRYSYIHFAAHATANKNSPLDSAIILSRGNTSGRLSVKEVLGMPVHADLVTISACHSAGARTYGGEGLVGFAWAFLQSGAQGVVAGLWDVSDYSSPLLMRDLYGGLAASKSAVEALRAAKLKLIDGGKYADPYYWGAFQLYEGALP